MKSLFADPSDLERDSPPFFGVRFFYGRGVDAAKQVKLRRDNFWNTSETPGCARSGKSVQNLGFKLEIRCSIRLS
jgi:hypothetical protein